MLGFPVSSHRLFSDQRGKVEVCVCAQRSLWLTAACLAHALFICHCIHPLPKVATEVFGWKAFLPKMWGQMNKIQPSTFESITWDHLSVKKTLSYHVSQPLSSHPRLLACKDKIPGSFIGKVEGGHCFGTTQCEELKWYHYVSAYILSLIIGLIKSSFLHSLFTKPSPQSLCHNCHYE